MRTHTIDSAANCAVNSSYSPQARHNLDVRRTAWPDTVKMLTSQCADMSTSSDRDNGNAGVARLVRSEEGFKRRIRMSIASFERLYTLVRPHLRRPGDGWVGHPPTVVPRVRLTLTLFWLAHGGSQFVACEVSDDADSTFASFQREVLAAISKSMPRMIFPSSLAA